MGILEGLKRELSVSEQVRLRMATVPAAPMTWGIFRHVILLPQDAMEWSSIRRRLVLAHELAHIKRADGLGQILAQCVCSLYWFNPAVWYAAYRLQVERERACDDQVLRLGASAVDYADHLLQIARGLNSRFILTAVSMAQPSQLKSRMLAILDPRTRRKTLSLAASTALLMLVAGLTLSTAVVQITAMASLALPEIGFPGLPILAAHEAEPRAEAAQPEGLQAPAATGPASIEGRILDATTSEPVAEVDISLPQPNGVPRVAATTNSEGRFVIEGLMPGSHLLTTTKEGYAPVRPEGRRAPGEAGTLITVRAGEAVKDVVLRLHKSAVLTGRVFDTQGRPVSRAEVSLVRRAYDQYGQAALTRHSFARTNDRGEFRAFGLAAGEYYVQVRAMDRLGMAPQSGDMFQEAFYPGVSDVSRATLIKLDWGTELRLGDTTVQPVRGVPVRLKLVNETGEPESGVRSYTLFRNGEVLVGVTSGSSLTGGPGRFELPSLTPGAYDIAVGWGGNDRMSGVRTTIEVTGTEVTGDLVIRRAPVVSGRFLLQAVDGSLTPVAASMRLEKIGFQLAVAGDPEGRFSIPAVPNEEYRTRFARLPAGAYVLSMKQDGVPVRADQVRVSRDTMLEVVFASESGTVEGMVRNSKGERVAGALVTVIPEKGDQGHLYRTGTTDQNGRFSIGGVAPGSYQTFAWTNMEGAAYRNAEFMKTFEDRGAAVSVKAGAAAAADLRAADEAKEQK
jgi:protocatechuate 3,4-dioxygenase beta subunit